MASVTDESSDRRVAAFLPAVLLGALLVRLAFLLISGRAIDSPDSIHYIAMAQQFRAGEFFAFDDNLPVLYSALGAFAHLVWNNWERAFWTVSLVCSTLTIAPVYWISRELHGERTARVMALMMCIWPWLVDYGSRVQTESIAVLLWFSGIWLTYRAVVSGGIYLAAAPAALFALHLARPEGTFLMLGAPLGAVLLCWREEGQRFRRVVALSVTVALLAGAYALGMKAIIGTATVSYRAPMAGDLVSYFQHGGIELARTFQALTFEVLPVMLGPFLLIFMGLGVFSRPAKGHAFGLELFVLYFCGIQYGLALANFSPSPRYMMPVVIALSLWSAFGMIRARDKLLAQQRRRLAALPAVLVFGALAFALIADLASHRLGQIPRTPVEYRDAGKWMAENLEPGLMFARKAQIGFYAGMPSIGLEAEDGVPEMLRKAESTGARYLVVDERYGAQLIPGLAPLLDPENAPDTLRPRYEGAGSASGSRVVVYEIAVPGMRYLAPEEFPQPDSHMGPYERRRTQEPEA